ncbi:zinc finger protein OZF-like, partial [Asbolus verrucosus]
SGKAIKIEEEVPDDDDDKKPPIERIKLELNHAEVDLVEEICETCKKPHRPACCQQASPKELSSFLNSYISDTELYEPEIGIERVKIPTDNALMSKPDEDDAGLYFTCLYCPKMFTLKRDVLEHVCEEHGEDFDTSFVQRLKKEKRKNPQKVDRDEVNAAKVEVDGRTYYNCKECGKSLYSSYTYVCHMRIHTGERPHACDLCGKRFRVNQGLVRHLRETHQGMRDFPCDLCGRMFATRRSAEEHRRIHTNERPHMCDLCGKSFKQKASLFIHRRAHENSYAFKCSSCDKGFHTQRLLMVHITKHTGEKPYRCDICQRCFRIKYELKRHQLVHSDEKPWGCAECGLRFRQKRYLMNHTKSKDAIKSEDDPPSDEDAERAAPKRIKLELGKGFCEICNKTISRSRDLKRHRAVCHPQTILKRSFDDVADLSTKTCTECSLTFANRTLLKKHVKDAHDVKQKRHRRKNNEIVAHFFCDVCEKGFTRKYDMEKHKSRLHADRPKEGDTSARKKNMELLNQCRKRDSDGKAFYKCDYCERVFAQSYNLMRHRTIHTGVRAYFCHICGKSFRMSNGLTRHIDAFHHGVKNFSCDVCKKTFTARATRDEHMNIHTNNRPFVCDVCGKCFKQKASLHVHKMFHTDMYRFQCNNCGKKFRRAQDLKVHSWLHTGHRPYSCHKCKAAFRLGHDLKRHLRIHEKVNDCVCNECGSVFSQERYLKVHKKIHKKPQIKLEDPLK